MGAVPTTERDARKIRAEKKQKDNLTSSRNDKGNLDIQDIKFPNTIKRIIEDNFSNTSTAVDTVEMELKRYNDMVSLWEKHFSSAELLTLFYDVKADAENRIFALKEERQEVLV